MPAYSFKERFIPLIKSGEKKQTIRAKRKHQAKKGDVLYLYFGMRTKWCMKIKETICTDVRSIAISKKGVVKVGGKRLSLDEKIQLAYADGFRWEKEGKSSIDAWEVMFRWWNQTHSLPFKGDIIYW